MRYNNQFFTPIFGEDLLPIKPSIVLEKGEFNKNISLLFGTCNDEGSGFVSSFGFKDLSSSSPNSSMNLEKAHFMIELLFGVMKVSYGKEVADFYTKGLTDNDGYELKKAVSNAFGDYQLTCPTIRFGAHLAKTPANTQNSLATSY
ncbi:unnamed protein product [Oppiella nova]|uniref:Carboxylesterase type B domain-containing protein n=1 Tax=Oppiella nova TaxID=334625 RepID=A0A7R9MQ96_9ACAR|nr:unnamed protein product [Oppiella nova]CAG2181674.1 unnamed protein product [Oppiella nova]